MTVPINDDRTYSATARMILDHLANHGPSTQQEICRGLQAHSRASQASVAVALLHLRMGKTLRRTEEGLYSAATD